MPSNWLLNFNARVRARYIERKTLLWGLHDSKFDDAPMCCHNLSPRAEKESPRVFASCYVGCPSCMRRAMEHSGTSFRFIYGIDSLADGGKGKLETVERRLRPLAVW